MKKELILNYKTDSPEKTEETAFQLADMIAKEPSVYAGSYNIIFIAMYGDLGVGKTAFTRGFVRRFAPDEAVYSPTYSLVNEYGDKTKIYHYDMYRITGEDDLESTGFYDYKNCIIISEWCENIPYALPDSYIKVEITKTDIPSERNIVIERVTV